MLVSHNSKMLPLFYNDNKCNLQYKLETFLMERNLFDKDNMQGTYTNKVPVGYGKHYFFYKDDGSFNTQLKTYDDSGSELSTTTISGSLGYIVTNPIIKYIAFNTFGNTNIIAHGTIIEGTHCYEEYYSYGEKAIYTKSVLSGKQWLVLGDSISTGNDVKSSSQAYATKPYHVLLAKKYGMIVENGAVSGYTTDNMYNNVILNLVPNSDYVPDLITIHIGTNDASYNVDMETPFRKSLDKLKELYPQAKIGIIAPIDRSDQLERVLEYVNKEVEIANEYNIPCLNIYKKEPWSFANQDDVNTYTCENSSGGHDGLHPNNLGHELLTKQYIEQFVLSLMS